jgi:hypothetical protein
MRACDKSQQLVTIVLRLIPYVIKVEPFRQVVKNFLSSGFSKIESLVYLFD